MRTTTTDQNGFYRIRARGAYSLSPANTIVARCFVGPNKVRTTEIRLDGVDLLDENETIRRDGYIAASRRVRFTRCLDPTITLY